jgi:Ser/Thr protein kinase RdoA (MazF antagonist)
VTDPAAVHELITREPPPQAVEWVRRAIGPKAQVVSVSALAGGTSHGNHALVVETPGSTFEVVLRRWVRPDWRETDPEYSAAYESAAYGLLAKTEVPAPRLLAADVDGDECDVPALLLTRAPGRRIGSAEIARMVRPLAEAIAVLHASAVAEAAGALLPYSPFCEPAAVTVPVWSTRPEAWQRAIELSSLPGGDTCTFIHRDYHPGNTVWVGDAVSAIVDWTTASWGPPQVDLSHMRVNLALSTGLDAADAFLAAYRSVSGSDPLDPLWDLKMAVDFVPDLREERMTAQELARLDEFVLAGLAAL